MTRRAPLHSAALARLIVLLLCLGGCRSAPPSVSPDPSASSVGAAPLEQEQESAAASPSVPTPAEPPTLGPLRAHFLGAPASTATRVAVLLHGYGDRGDGLVALGSDLVRARPGLAAVALEARLPRPEGGRMWWPIDIERVRAARLRGEWPQLSRERPVGADEARDAVVLALRALADQGVQREQVVLAGFSQGAMLAVDVGLAHPELLGAVVAWSGAIIDREHWEQRAAPGVRFVVAHGQRDAMLPFSEGEALHSLLRNIDAGARWVPFDGPHTVSAEGRAALLELLAGP